MILTLLAFALSAQAAPGPYIACVPVAPLESPLRVSWDSILGVESLNFVANGPVGHVELQTKIHDDFQNKDYVVTDVYGASPDNRAVLVRDRSASKGLELSSATFEITEIKMPFSAGPPIPGTWDATATLVLVAKHRSAPGASAEIVDVRSIDLSCKYRVGP